MSYKNGFISAEQYQQNLFNEFTELSGEDIEAIILLSKIVIDRIKSAPEYDASVDDELWLIESIIEYAEEHRTLSFKQWKALNAFKAKYKRNQTTKSF